MSLYIRFLEAARAEYDAAADWYEQRQTGLGTEFLDAISDVLDRIAANPSGFRKVYRDVRKAVVARFPYVILFQEEPDEVLIVAVFHTSRNPAVWRGRV